MELTIGVEIITFILVILLSPLSVLAPAIISDQFNPFPPGDASWLFIGPITYVYGVVIASGFGILTYVSGLLLQSQSPALLGVSVIGGISLLLLCVCTVLFGYQTHRKRKHVKEVREEYADATEEY